jgi:hypothetical protein
LDYPPRFAKFIAQRSTLKEVPVQILRPLAPKTVTGNKLSQASLKVKPKDYDHQSMQLCCEMAD